MNKLAKNIRGRFLVVDGPDGAGKTTQLNLLQEYLESIGLTVTRAIDPGGTAVGTRIRDILLHNHDDLSPMCETFLFMASRAQLVAEVVRPAMKAGKVVLCDRFISATVAYQGALGVKPKMIVELGEIAVENLWPDLTIVLDLPSATGLGRLGRKRDRMESRPEDYHDLVRRKFHNLSRTYPAPVARVDADGKPEDVAERVREKIRGHFGS